MRITGFCTFTGLTIGIGLAGCILEDDDDPIDGTDDTNETAVGSAMPGGSGGGASTSTGSTATAGAGGATTAGAGTCDGAEPLPRAIEEDLTIGPGCVRIDQLEVNGAATLTIVPGTRIELAPGGFLSVGRNGGSPTVSAVGTPDAPITFTSSNASPRAGDWQCIYLDGDGSELDNVIVEYGGAACGATGAGSEGMVQIYGTPRGITNATIQDSSTVGVQLKGTPVLFANNTFHRNAIAPIRVTANSLTSIGFPNAFDAEDVIVVEADLVTRSGTWSNHGVPYVFSAGFGIQGEITVAAGVRIEMTDGSLDVGTFDLLGTADQPVVFTSAQANPAPGDWGCIYSGAALRIEHAVIEYAGSGQSCTGASYPVAISAASGTTITDTVFRNISGSAFRTDCGEDVSAWCATNTFEGLTADPLLCGNEPTACP